VEAINTIALTMGTAWASGINLYATIFMLGFMGAAGYLNLPPDLMVLTDPIVLFIAAVMYFIEFFVDKTPGADSGWDAIHTFIRIPAGAVLAMGAVGDVNQAAELAAFLVGGTLAAQSHFVKAGSRALINTSPEPVSNWTASLTEDFMVIGGLWTALHHPVWFLVFLAAFILISAWLLPKLWRGIKRVAQKIAGFFKGKAAGDVDPHALGGSPRLPDPDPRQK
jgi:hypothetical protein